MPGLELASADCFSIQPDTAQKSFKDLQRSLQRLQGMPAMPPFDLQVCCDLFLNVHPDRIHPESVAMRISNSRGIGKGLYAGAASGHATEAKQLEDRTAGSSATACVKLPGKVRRRKRLWRGRWIRQPHTLTWANAECLTMRLAMCFAMHL